MSYNIDSIKFLSGELSLSKTKFLELLEKCKDELPEDSFFCRDDVELITMKTKGNKTKALASDECPDRLVWTARDTNRSNTYKNKLRWRCSGSGSTYDTFKYCLSQMEGEADLVVIWEGGDSVYGLRVRNGQVSEHKVGYILLDK